MSIILSPARHSIVHARWSRRRAGTRRPRAGRTRALAFELLPGPCFHAAEVEEGPDQLASRSVARVWASLTGAGDVTKVGMLAQHVGRNFAARVSGVRNYVTAATKRRISVARRQFPGARLRRTRRPASSDTPRQQPERGRNCGAAARRRRPGLRPGRFPDTLEVPRQPGLSGALGYHHRRIRAGRTGRFGLGLVQVDRYTARMLSRRGAGATQCAA